MFDHIVRMKAELFDLLCEAHVIVVDIGHRRVAIGVSTDRVPQCEVDPCHVHASSVGAR